MVIESLGERVMLTANLSIDMPDNAVPGEAVAVQVSYSGNNGGGSTSGAFADSFGATRIGRTATDVDIPVDGIFVGDTFEVIGQDAGKGAAQRYDATGSRDAVTHFDSLLSAQGNGGSEAGMIWGVAELLSGGVMYVGDSAGTVSISQPTYWQSPDLPQGGYGVVGAQESGVLLDISRTGVYVGSDDVAFRGVQGYPPERLPGANAIFASSIAADAQYIVGSLVWTSNTLGGYDVVDTSGFDFSVPGITPTWSGVEVDSAGDVYFAGEYFDLNTFATAVGFWNGTGEYLGSFGTNFADFEVVEGDVIAAVNGFDDGSLVRLRDGATIAIEDLTGSKATFPRKGLFATEEALGLLLQDTSGPFVTIVDTIGGSSSDPERADLHLDFDGDGIIDQVIRNSTGDTVDTSCLRAGTYTATVIATDSSGNELGRSSDVINVTPFRVANRNGESVLLIAADQSRGGTVTVVQQAGALQVSVGGVSGRVTASAVEIIGSPRSDVVYLNGNFSATVDLGPGNDVLTSIGGDLDADLGSGHDVATSIRGNHVRLRGGNGNDLLVSLGHRFAFLDGGTGNDVLTTQGFSSFLIGGAGSDLFTVLDKRTVVVTDDLQTSSDLERRTLVDTVFAELGKASPNMNSLSNQLQSLRIDDGVRDTGLVLSGLNRVLQTPRDRLLVLPVLF
jgi:hypothetical protein